MSNLNSEHIFHIAVADKAVPITIIIQDADGTLIDVSGDTAITFLMVDDEGAVVVNYAAATFVTDGTNGQVKYTFATADVDTAGEFYGYFRREITSGVYAHYPPEAEMLKILIHSLTV